MRPVLTTLSVTASLFAAATATAPWAAAAHSPAAHAATRLAPRPAAVPDVDDAPCVEHLRPNAVYRAHRAIYRTDGQGRPARVEAADVKASVADRGPCQRKVGHMAPTSGYDGGHLIAATLDGVDRRYDLVPQWASVNRGIYERIEAGAKACLKAPGGTIRTYRITVTYPDDRTLVPDAFHTDIALVTSNHPQERIKLVIPNRALHRAEYDRLRSDLDHDLHNAGCK